MATLITPHFTPPAIDFRSGDIQKQIAAAWAAIEQQGDLLTFGVADGQAVYIVRSIHPPRLQWVDWLDGYRANPALIRGLRSKDIEQMIDARERMAALFGKPS